MRIANTSSSISNQIVCSSINSSGGTVTEYAQIPANSTQTLFTTADAIVYVDCIFGDRGGGYQTTHVNLMRLASDYEWVGFLTSTYNQ
jgi:hypothetical protein